MNRNRNTWAVHKNGSCFSCNLSLRPFIQENDMQLMGTFLKKNELDYILINDKTWVIESCGTRFFSEIFQIRSEVIYDREV